MSIQLSRYLVLVADPKHPDDPDHATEHEVTILHGDQLRAELEGPQHGILISEENPMGFHLTTLWIWAALMRAHVIDEPFQVFKPRMLAFEDADKGADISPAPGSSGDPTRPAAGSGSPSPSPSAGPESTGRTPADRSPALIPTG